MPIYSLLLGTKCLPLTTLFYPITLPTTTFLSNLLQCQIFLPYQNFIFYSYTWYIFLYFFLSLNFISPSSFHTFFFHPFYKQKSLRMCILSISLLVFFSQLNPSKSVHAFNILSKTAKKKTRDITWFYPKVIPQTYLFSDQH